MKLILEAIKSLFRKMETSITKATVATVMAAIPKKLTELENDLVDVDGIAQGISNAQTTADNAQSHSEGVATDLTAETAAREEADATKMEKKNPVGTGSFSMNRQESSDVGDFSMAAGYGSVANHFAESVSGQYNVYEPTICAEHLESEEYTTEKFNKSYAYYYSEEYSFEPTTGVYTLVNPSSVYNDTILSEMPGHYIILTEAGDVKPNVTEGGRIMLVSNTIKASTNLYRARGAVYSAAQNLSGKGTYAHIVGNGTSDTERSNAHTLDWDGNAWYAGGIEGTALILPSSTADSTKKFKIIVDDSGTITATEVT